MSEVFNFIYRGGVKVENNVRYLTAEKPPTDDNSNKVPTTEWVKEKIDAVEDTVSGGMNATVSKITSNKAPSGGGTWYCYGIINIRNKSDNSNRDTVDINSSFASGATLYSSAYWEITSINCFGIKIA